MRIKSFRRGLISISLIFALVPSMAFTAASVLAHAVISEPGGDIIEIEGARPKKAARRRVLRDISFSAHGVK